MTDFIAAESAVRQLYARYTNAVWRKDYTAVGECYTEDAEWRIEGSVWRGRAAITGHLEGVLVKFQRVLVNLLPPILDVGKGRVTARTHSVEQGALVDGTPVYSMGTYFDRIVNDRGMWRFSWRLFQTDYVGTSPLSGQFFDTPDYGPPPAMPPLDAQTVDRSGIHPQ
jgi:hypothetical protein